MNVTLESTPAKYQPMASEMIQSLLALLKELTSLEGKFSSVTVK